jgi:hypothetical protein
MVRLSVGLLALLPVASCEQKSPIPTANTLLATPTPSLPPVAVTAPPVPAAALTATPPIPSDGCREQPPVSLLLESHTNHFGALSPTERRAARAKVNEAIRYRSELYGWARGFRQAGGTAPAERQCRLTKFFGVPVVLHEKVIPVLACVEKALRRECAATPYQPHLLSGLRKKNSYFDGDVSNHMFGIALDVDPDLNPCCKCLRPYRDNPRCKGDKPLFERMAMPRCWVEVFERYGFYWLGHDVLEDSMHFEFLGIP